MAAVVLDPDHLGSEGVLSRRPEGQQHRQGEAAKAQKVPPKRKMGPPEADGVQPRKDDHRSQKKTVDADDPPVPGLDVFLRRHPLF